MLLIILLLGKIREILTSDDKTIQMNDLTSVYLDYIKMIEKKEEASKDAPTEEVKKNVTKIYNKVTSGGMFSSLTSGIRGMFSSTRAATSSNAAQSVNAGQGSSSGSNRNRAAITLPRPHWSMPMPMPKRFSQAKAFLHTMIDIYDRRTLSNNSRREVYKSAHKIIMCFQSEIRKDPETVKYMKWLSDNAQHM